MLPFTGSSQLQQQQSSNYPRPPRATDDPSRHSTVSAAPVGGRPDLATVETTARGPLHPIRRGALPTDRVQHTQSQEQTRNLRDAGQAAVPVGGSGAWPDNEPTRRAKLAARTARGRAAAHGRTKQHGPEQQREGRCTRYGALHPLRGAAPVTGRCTRYGPLHPLRGAAPDQKRCTAYGSGAAHPITRTNAESARREPGCGTRGRRLGLAGQRADAPSEARGADDSRAGRRPRARQAARPSAAAQPQLSTQRSADTPRRTVTAIRDGNAGGGQPVA